MTDVLTASDPVEDFFAHYGVKGMKWGVVNDEPSGGKVYSTANYKAVKRPTPSKKQQLSNIAKSETRFQEKANPDGRHLSDEQKRAMKIAAGVVAVGLLAGGAAYAAKKYGIKTPNPMHDEYFNQMMLAKENAWGKLGYIHDTSYSRPAFTLPSGHVFTRISTVAEKGYSSATYTSHNAADVNRYLGEGYGRVAEAGGNLYRVTFRAKEDVRVPDLNTVLAAARNVIKAETNSDPSPSEVLSWYRQASGSDWSDSRSTSLFNSLVKQGYHALVDEMDAGVQADSPLVVFAQNAFTEKTTASLSMSDVLAARQNITLLSNPKL